MDTDTIKNKARQWVNEYKDTRHPIPPQFKEGVRSFLHWLEENSDDISEVPDINCIIDVGER